MSKKTLLLGKEYLFRFSVLKSILFLTLLVSLLDNVSISLNNVIFSGNAISAAAVGVGALLSAA